VSCAINYGIIVQKHASHRACASWSEYASSELGQSLLLMREFHTKQDFQAVVDLCHDERRIGWLESLVIPIRTDNVQNFCEDFFLPGFFNFALTTNDLAVKIFLCIITPIYDILFFINF